MCVHCTCVSIYALVCLFCSSRMRKLLRKRWWPWITDGIMVSPLVYIHTYVFMYVLTSFVCSYLFVGVQQWELQTDHSFSSFSILCTFCCILAYLLGTNIVLGQVSRAKPCVDINSHVLFTECACAPVIGNEPVHLSHYAIYAAMYVRTQLCVIVCVHPSLDNWTQWISQVHY